MFKMVLVCGLLVAAPVGAQELSREVASRFAKQVVASVQREYPNKPDHVLNRAKDAVVPRVAHPAFFGSFDWHSSVHGHWMLVALLRQYPDLPEAAAMRAVLDEHLTPANLQAEVAYVTDPGHKGFERTYGWAWLLKLAAELKTLDTPDGQRWSANLQPLADAVVERCQAFLPKLTYPNRTGVHPNTAFTLNLALDYARAARNPEFEALLLERARTYYGQDRNGPLAWEPAGEDFLSPCLEEAALMRKVLPPKAYRPWLEGFLPTLLRHGVMVPAKVSDRTDPRIVHLDGLNLTRARCLHLVATGLGSQDPRAAALERTARLHAQEALPHVVSGNFEGDHWLATFAVYMLQGF